MEKLYSWRRKWKHLKRHYSKFILVGVTLTVTLGLVIFSLALLFTVIQLPEPLPDLRNVAVIARISVLGVGAIAYWGIVGAIAWRWLKTRQRHWGVIPKVSKVAPPVDFVPPKITASSLAQRSRRVPAVALSPAEFEQEVAFVLGTLFGLHSEVVGKANDGGIDVKLYDATQTLVAIVQAKRYDENKALSPSFLRDIDSCKRRTGVARAYLVTTARFSSDVRQQAQEWHIDLVDGILFEDWRQRAYIGLQKPNSYHHHNNLSRRG